MIYHGEIMHFMAGQFSNRIYLEGEEEHDEEFLEESYKSMMDNLEVIRNHYPNAPFFLLECTHWDFFEKKNLQKIKDMMASYWRIGGII